MIARLQSLLLAAAAAACIPAHAVVDEDPGEVIKSTLKVEDPNTEARIAMQCVEGAESLSAAANCVAQRLTTAELKKCAKSLELCYGKNNTLRKLLDGSMASDLQDAFNRSDLGKAFRGEVRMPTPNEIKESRAGKELQRLLAPLGVKL